MVSAWLRDDSEVDPHLPHKLTPSVYLTLEDLAKFGVTYKKMNPDKWSDGDRYHEDPELKEFSEIREFLHSDVLEITRETLENYDEKLKCFYKEHFHLDDECRYVIDGSGYFDVRDENDRWVRVHIVKGDLIQIPAGLYHRYTLDEKNYHKSIRLFVGDAIWTPVYRPADEHFVRKKYVEKYCQKV